VGSGARPRTRSKPVRTRVGDCGRCDTDPCRYGWLPSGCLESVTHRNKYTQHTFSGDVKAYTPARQQGIHGYAQSQHGRDPGQVEARHGGQGGDLFSGRVSGCAVYRPRFQHLIITTLELSALAIVICSIMTSACWWHKPADVMTPIKIYLKDGVTLDKVRKEAGGFGTERLDTDNARFHRRPTSRLGSECASIHENANRPAGETHASSAQRQNPQPKGITRDHPLRRTSTLRGYPSLRLNWNWDFPTRIKLTLWRVSSMFLFGNTVAFWVCESLSAWWRVGRCQRLFYGLFWRSKLPDLEASLKQTQTSGKPKQLPLSQSLSREPGYEPSTS
jgi:hypothetical protein